jgi:hypothetical protein
MAGDLSVILIGQRRWINCTCAENWGMPAGNLIRGTISRTLFYGLNFRIYTKKTKENYYLKCWSMLLQDIYVAYIYIYMDDLYTCLTV